MLRYLHFPPTFSLNYIQLKNYEKANPPKRKALVKKEDNYLNYQTRH